jgi:hypothetical protein
MSNVFDLPLGGLDGTDLNLGALSGRTVLIVNIVAPRAHAAYEG